MVLRNLYRILAIVSFGFYVHPCGAFECPGHPRDAEEIAREEREQENDLNPLYHEGTDEQKKACDEGTGSWASKD